MQRFSMVLLAALFTACSSNGGGGQPYYDDDAGDDAADGDDATPPSDKSSPGDAPDDVAAPDAPADAAPDAPDDVTAPDAAPDAGPDVACATGQTLCAGACVDTATDNGNCGACGTTCPATQTCMAGACAPMCAAGRTRCGSACVDTSSDNGNCGACGMACAAGQSCDAGACVTPCAPDQTRCDGRCVNALSDGMNCGACGRACAAGQMCAAGACVTTCMPGQALCGAGMGRPGSCATLTSDSSNCGSCGNVCPAGQSCVTGACACPAGQSLCGAACVDTTSDNAHCGACGRACPSSQSCSAGACVCPGGRTPCGSACVDTQTDVTACGRCGLSCATGESCVAGVCLSPGPANDACASPTAIDLSRGPAITVTGTTTGAHESANSCRSTPDVFYQLTLTSREVVYADTFGTAWDTYLGIQRPGCGASATACTDDSCGTAQSQLTQVLDPGTYLLVVEPFSGAGGEFTLHVQHYPVGNGSVSPLDLSGGTRRLSGTTSGTGAVSSTCCSYGAENTYFAATCPSFGEVGFRASTCGLATYDTELDLRSGNRAASGGSVCNDDSCGLQSLITGRLPAGAGLHVLYADACSGSGPYAIDLTIGDCPAGQTLCGAACADTQSDRANCGACGSACIAGQSCVSGVCRGATTYVFSTGAAAFVDACALPGHTTQLASSDDAVGTATNIGFMFPFYGSPYTQVRPSTNGYFLFGTGGANDYAYYPTMALPDASRPYPAAFVYNSDLYTRGTGVCLGLTGSAPSRRFVIEGVDETYFPSSTSAHLTFEAILNEADGSMDFVYQTVNTAGDTHNNLVGVQNNGTTGVTYEYRANGPLTRVSSGTSLHLSPR